MLTGGEPGPDRPLRVLMVHNRYRSGQPSGEDRVVDQETALLRAAGHEVEAFERRSDDIAGMSVPARAAVPLRVPWNGAVRAELLAVLRARRPDVVHVHNTFPLLSPSVVAACTTAGVPLVATLHNYTLVCPSGTLFRSGRVCSVCVGASPLPAVRHGCYRGSAVATVPIAVSAALNRDRWWSGVTRFFCISGSQRRLLADAGMPPDKLVVKYNFVLDPAQHRQGPGGYVLFLGRLTQEKGARLLMAGWDHLVAGGPPGVPLVIAGAGPLEGEVRRWAAGRADVRVLGLQGREESARLVAGAMALVAPSEWMETFGLVVVEAQAAGVPVVAAGHGAFAELVDDGVTGLLHRPHDPASLADGLRRITSSPDANARMGAAARLRYERDFTPHVGLERLEAGYADAITAAATGPGVAAPA
jgi:glycosyltransferase involved in cell wall biosynthesis